MAYAFVASKTAVNNTPQTTLLTGAGNDTAGNLLVALILQTAGNAAPTVSDTRNNSYVSFASVSDAAATHTLYAFYALNIASQTNSIVTATNAAACIKGVSVPQYSGIASFGAFAGSSTNAQISLGVIGANAVSSGNVTPSTAPGMLFGAVCDVSFAGHNIGAVGTGFTTRTNVWQALNSGGTQATLSYEDMAYSTTTPVPATWATVSATQNESFISIAAAFTLPIVSTGQNGGELLMGCGS